MLHLPNFLIVGSKASKETRKLWYSLQVYVFDSETAQQICCGDPICRNNSYCRSGYYRSAKNILHLGLIWLYQNHWCAFLWFYQSLSFIGDVPSESNSSDLLCHIQSQIQDAFSGHLITFGCNTFGQLGVGDFKERKGVNLIAGVLAGKVIQKVSCGDGYTVVSTSENQVCIYTQITY